MDREPTVFIIDDDPAVRQALTVLVRSMQLRPQAFESAQHFLDGVQPCQFGCLLLDVRMPGTSGLDLLDELRRRDIHLPAIVISAYGDVPMVVRAMRAGALNFLEKPCRDQQLWDAIQEAIKWDAANRGRLSHRAKARRRMEHLSSGERDVLRLLVDGQPNKAIADELKLSVRTIEVRRAKLMKKMKAESLAELVRLVFVADPHFRENSAPVGNGA